VDRSIPFGVITQILQFQLQSRIFQKCQSLFVMVQPLPITLGYLPQLGIYEPDP